MKKLVSPSRSSSATLWMVACGNRRRRWSAHRRDCSPSIDARTRRVQPRLAQNGTDRAPIPTHAPVSCSATGELRAHQKSRVHCSPAEPSRADIDSADLGPVPQQYRDSGRVCPAVARALSTCDPGRPDLRRHVFLDTAASAFIVPSFASAPARLPRALSFDDYPPEVEPTGAAWAR